jgi:hypothetical protein
LKKLYSFSFDLSILYSFAINGVDSGSFIGDMSKNKWDVTKRYVDYH